MITRTVRTHALLAIAVLAFGGRSLPAAGSYNFTTIDYPGAVHTYLLAINDAGQVVGGFTDASNRQHGFLLAGGVFTPIDYPGAYHTTAWGINANGDIVGSFNTISCYNGYGCTFPFLLKGGVYTPLPEAPNSMAGTTVARGINSGGQIIGWYVDPCFCTAHAFLLSGGVFAIIDVPVSGLNSFGPNGINDTGAIVVQAQAVWGGGGPHAYLRSSTGTYTNIDEPGAGPPPDGTAPMGINASGQVVGRAASPAETHQFVLSNGTYADFLVPLVQQQSAATSEGINAGGQIVGMYSVGGINHGFLATPAGPLYKLCLLYDSTRAVNSGATIPIKLQLCDISGNDLSASGIVLHATGVTQTSNNTSGLVQDAGNANPDADFRFDLTLGSTGGYIFNLSTKGLTTGSYTLNFTVTGESFAYSAPFQVK